MAEYDDMTGEEFQIHLFIESANSHMQTVATELLGKENPTMQQLKVKEKETENATLYNQKREYGNMANMKKDKYCQQFNSKIHSKAECWGSCSHC